MESNQKHLEAQQRVEISSNSKRFAIFRRFFRWSWFQADKANTFRAQFLLLATATVPTKYPHVPENATRYTGDGGNRRILRPQGVDYNLVDATALGT